MVYNDLILSRYHEFMDHWITKRQAIYCCRMMFELTYYGFERYIGSYFYKNKWFLTNYEWGPNDWWIDIIGWKSIWKKIIHLAIQCKKRFYDYIREGEVLTFIHNFEKKWRNKSDYELYLATTADWNKESKKIAKEKDINIINCRKLLEMEKKYSLDDFEKDFGKNKYNKIFYKKRFFTDNNVRYIIENWEKGSHTKNITRYNLLSISLKNREYNKIY